MRCHFGRLWDAEPNAVAKHRRPSHNAVIRVDDDGGNKLRKCSPFFIRVHNETLSIIAMCVSNKDCSSL
jgi:hypothetical protein